MHFYFQCSRKTYSLADQSTKQFKRPRLKSCNKPKTIPYYHSAGQFVYLLEGQINIVKTALVKIRAFERHLEIIEPFQPFSFVFCPQLGILTISFV